MFSRHVYAIFVLFVSILGCNRAPYDDIKDVPETVNSLGRAVAAYQRQEVWTGGSEASGSYTLEHRYAFQRKDGVNLIVKKASNSRVFMDGVAGLKSLPQGKLDMVLRAWSKPIDLRWEQTGEIGNGTTLAGQITEKEIAEALVELIKSMLKK